MSKKVFKKRNRFFSENLLFKNNSNFQNILDFLNTQNKSHQTKHHQKHIYKDCFVYDKSQFTGTKTYKIGCHMHP